MSNRTPKNCPKTAQKIDSKPQENCKNTYKKPYKNHKIPQENHTKNAQKRGKFYAIGVDLQSKFCI